MSSSINAVGSFYVVINNDQ